MIDYVAHVNDAYGAAKAGEIVVIRYDIRPSAQWREQYISRATLTAVGIRAGDDRGHLGYIHVYGGHSNDEAVVEDGFHLQSRQLAFGIGIDGVRHGIELTLCVVAEELEVRVVHVTGWAGRMKRGGTVVEAEWEAYVGNVATGSHAWSRISSSSNYVGDEKKKWDDDDDDYDGEGIRRILHHHHHPHSYLQHKP